MNQQHSTHALGLLFDGFLLTSKSTHLQLRIQKNVPLSCHILPSSIKSIRPNQKHQEIIMSIHIFYYSMIRLFFCSLFIASFWFVKTIYQFTRQQYRLNCDHYQREVETNQQVTLLTNLQTQNNGQSCLADSSISLLFQLFEAVVD